MQVVVTVDAFWQFSENPRKFLELGFTTYSKALASHGLKITRASGWRVRYTTSLRCCSLMFAGQVGDENGKLKFKCKPASTLCSLARLAARSESAMNTIALTEETLR